MIASQNLPVFHKTVDGFKEYVTPGMLKYSTVINVKTVAEELKFIVKNDMKLSPEMRLELMQKAIHKLSNGIYEDAKYLVILHDKEQKKIKKLLESKRSFQKILVSRTKSLEDAQSRIEELSSTNEKLSSTNEMLNVYFENMLKNSQKIATLKTNLYHLHLTQEEVDLIREEIQRGRSIK